VSVAATDYYVARVVELLEQRVADDLESELRTRRRIIQDGREAIRARQPIPTRPRSRSSFVEFRPDARPQFEINLGGQSLEAIYDELDRVASYGVESGGYLWGLYENQIDSALVTFASGPGLKAKHARDAVRLSDPRDIAAGFPEHMQRSELRRLGDFHSHPSGSPQPSQHDRRVWASVLESSGRSAYVGLIATPSVDGSGPQLHAWVTRPAGALGRYVCEPATIT
jgi:proteasome lid subunit RPN8/RPN11